MSIVPPPEAAAGLMVLPPDEALRRARPLPSTDSMALGDVPDDEWDALLLALGE